MLLGKLDMFQFFLSKVLHIHILDDDSLTPLHFVLQKKNKYLQVNYLLEKRANLNSKYGDWALRFFAAKGRLDNCQLLGSKGAHVDALEDKRYTPLYWLRRENIFVIENTFTEEKQEIKLEIVKLLLSKDSPINVLDKDRFTPLQYAMSERNFAIAVILLQKRRIYQPNKKKDEYQKYCYAKPVILSQTM